MSRIIFAFRKTLGKLAIMQISKGAEVFNAWLKRKHVTKRSVIDAIGDPSTSLYKWSLGIVPTLPFLLVAKLSNHTDIEVGRLADAKQKQTLDALEQCPW